MLAAVVVIALGITTFVPSGGKSVVPESFAAREVDQVYPFACPGGREVEPRFQSNGDSFSMEGRIASVNDGGRLLVKGPERYVRVKRDAETRTNDELIGGEVVLIKGKMEAGEPKATEIDVVCGPTPTPARGPSASAQAKPGQAPATQAPTGEPRSEEQPASPPANAATPPKTPEVTPKPIETSEATPTQDANPDVTEAPTATPEAQSGPPARLP
jgi:hypothetical protein